MGLLVKVGFEHIYSFTKFNIIHANALESSFLQDIYSGDTVKIRKENVFLKK